MSPPVPRFSSLLRQTGFLFAIPSLLRTPLSLSQAEDILRQRLSQREELFLALLRDRIFSQPHSPYLPLLREARCSLGDIASSIRRNGLEFALAELKRSGVYFTFEEFKGRVPVKRSGLEFRVHPANFDTPGLRRCVTRSTSGSTGAGVRVTMSLDHIAATAPYQLVFESGLGILHAPHYVLFQGFPGFLAPQIILRTLLTGGSVDRWFTPSGVDDGLKSRSMRESFLGLLRLLGHPVPRPEPLPYSQAGKMARHIHAALREHERCSLRSYLGAAVRTCSAAAEMGVDLTGCTFLVGGEAVTPGKAACIEVVGGRVAPGYSTTETSMIGLACLNPRDPSDVHLLSDAHALIQSRRKVPGWDFEVDAFLVTSLLPSAPKVMLNVESDDYGIVENRSCGCIWDKLGFRTHLRQIHSFCKLTGQGVTLIGSDALLVLDKVLPARFGGGPQDYQLCETETEGMTQVELVVDPRLDIPDEAAVIMAFLEAVRGSAIADPGTAAMWQEADALRVVRRPPAVAGRGKLLPLHLASRGDAP